MWLSVPLYWPQQSVPGPIPATRDSAWGAVSLGEVTVHLSERQQDAGLSWEEADFSCAAAGQTWVCPSRPPSSASALPTKQNRFLCWKFWHGGETLLQYSSQSLNIVVWDGVVGVHQKWNCASPFDSTGQVLETNDIFQDIQLLQLKTCSFSRVIFWCDIGTSQRKQALFKRNT